MTNRSSTHSLAVMPEVLKGIKCFDVCVRKAEQWLESVNSLKILHGW